MASIVRDSVGVRIQFSRGLGKRSTIRLARKHFNDEIAEQCLSAIEAWIAADFKMDSLDDVTRAWLLSVSDRLHNKLIQVGVPLPSRVPPPFPKPKIAIAKYARQYMDNHDTWENGTHLNVGQCIVKMIAFFGRDMFMEDVTLAHVDDFTRWLGAPEQKLSPATVGMTLRKCGGIFRDAYRRRVICENPFCDAKIPPDDNPDNEYFVSNEEIATLLPHLPNDEFRLVILLCRYGGLRCPSEVLELKWGCIDWVDETMTVYAQKTKRTRRIPLFPEFRDKLRAAFESKREGQVYVCDQYSGRFNLGTELDRRIRRAGLNRWPRLFNNLRASRNAELMAECTSPAEEKAICHWMGHSRDVSFKHYLPVFEEYYRKAVNAKSKLNMESETEAVKGS